MNPRAEMEEVMTDWETLNQLIEATAEAREVIREMHAATKDLKQAIKEARRVNREELDEGFQEKSRELLNDIAEVMDSHRKSLNESITKESLNIADMQDKVVAGMREVAQMVVQGLRANAGDPTGLAGWTVDTLQLAEHLSQPIVAVNTVSGKRRPVSEAEIARLRNSNRQGRNDV